MLLDPKLLLRIRVGRADPLHAMGRIEESVDEYREAIRLAGQLGDEQTVLACQARVPYMIYNTTLKDEVPRFCEDGLVLARKLGDQGAEAQIAANYAYWRYLWRHTDEYRSLEEALGLARDAANPQAAFLIQMLLGHVERWRGNPIRSLEYIRGPFETLQAACNITVASLLAFGRGLSLIEVGRYQEAVAHLTQWVEILERNNILISIGRCFNGLGWAHAEIYDLQRAFQLNRRSLEHAVGLQKSRAILFSVSEMQAMTEVNLIENLAEMGELDQAWEHIGRFETTSADPAYDMLRHRWTSRMNEVKAAILIARHQLDGAQALAEQILHVAKGWAMKKYVGKGERLLGQAMTRRCAYDRAEIHLQTALKKHGEVGNPKQLWSTHTALAELYEERKRPDQVREQWQAAAAIVRSTADGLEDEGLRETFLAAAPVFEILKHAKP
jgi:tetratricopeptide (TPR) repeat protein